MDTLRNCIDGEFVEPLGGRYLDGIEPATGQVYCRIPASDGRDVDHAVGAARAAFPAWSRTPAAERARLMLELAGRLDCELADYARAESVDSGKPIRLAREIEIPRAAANLRHFATAILHGSSESHAQDRIALNVTLRRPRGVAGLISPWNLPLYLLTWKIAPALATGNTVVAKPSELTPWTASMLARAASAILPRGVLNLVHGTGAEAGAALVAHPEVPTISFTGGTTTGAAIARVAAPMFKRLALELGGKNATIITAEADLDVAVPGALRAAFQNQGQICLCGSRILVDSTVFEEFLERFVAAARQLKVGDPLDEATDQGALVSRTHLDKVRGYVELARTEGGQILAGGRAPVALPERCRDGYFYEPTIVTGLGTASRVDCEEVFGPLVTISPFNSIDEAVERANATPYGLSASVWTRDLDAALTLAEGLDAGTVWINCWLVRDLRVPFGGMKQSGIGREGGADALRFFTEPKNVCIKYP